MPVFPTGMVKVFFFQCSYYFCIGSVQRKEISISAHQVEGAQSVSSNETQSKQWEPTPLPSPLPLQEATFKWGDADSAEVTNASAAKGPAWGSTWGLFDSVRGLSIHGFWCITCKGLLSSHAVLGGCSVVILALVWATTSSQGQTGGAWHTLFHTRTQQALSSGIAPAAYNHSKSKQVASYPQLRHSQVRMKFGVVTEMSTFLVIIQVSSTSLKKHWTYTCTFVAFLNIHPLLHYYIIFIPLGVYFVCAEKTKLITLAKFHINPFPAFCMSRRTYTCAVHPALVRSTKTLDIKMGLPCYSTYWRYLS